MDKSTAKYRITYEAFSKFSGNISKAEDMDALALVIKRDLKYLFDYKLYRMVFVGDSGTRIFTFFEGKYSSYLKMNYLTTKRNY